MIVFLGSFPGSNRKSVSNSLAAAHSFFSYDLEQHMIPTYKATPSAQGFATDTSYPRLDREWLKVYEKTAADFRMLSKLYERVIVSHSFHRKEPREYLFSQARKYFDVVIPIWLDVDDAQASRIIDRQSNAKGPGARERLLRTRSEIKSSFQAFDKPVLSVRYDETDHKASTEALWSLIETAASKKSYQ